MRPQSTQIKVKNARRLAAALSAQTTEFMARRYCGIIYSPELEELNILFADTDTMGDDVAFRKFCSRQPLSLSKKLLAGQTMLVFDQQLKLVFALRASLLWLKSARRSVQALVGRYAR